MKKRMILGAAAAALSLATATSAFAGSRDGCNYYGRDCAPTFRSAESYGYSNGYGYSYGNSIHPKTEAFLGALRAFIDLKGQEQSYKLANKALDYQAMLAVRQQELQREAQNEGFVVDIAQLELQARAIQAGAAAPGQVPTGYRRVCADAPCLVFMDVPNR